MVSGRVNRRMSLRQHLPPVEEPFAPTAGVAEDRTSVLLPDLREVG